MKEVPNQKAKLMGSVSVSRATDGTPPRKEVKNEIINNQSNSRSNFIPD